MGEGKHTPGPWIAGQLPDGDPETGPDGTYYFDGTFFTVCDDEPEDVNLSNPANARLVAAAPELLEALKALLSDQSNFMAKHPAVAAARAAIAKAEGGTP